MNSIIEWFSNLLAGIPKEAIVFIISMVPILELRGGLIAASLLGVDIVPALILCIIGNILPVPFILWFITPLFSKLKQWHRIRPTVEKLEAKALAKGDKVRKYEFWGLVLFVGIPLPGTGAWTGSLIAALLEIPRKKAVFTILLGLIMAAAIMSFFTYGLPWIIGGAA